jgi:hypothetical protein
MTTRSTVRSGADSLSLLVLLPAVLVGWEHTLGLLSAPPCHEQPMACQVKAHLPDAVAVGDIQPLPK